MQTFREQKWVFDISDQGESSHLATLGLQDQGSSLCCGLFKMPGQTTIYWQDKAYSDGARARTQNIGKLKEGTYSKPASKLYNHFIKNGHTTQDFVIFGIEEIFGDEFTAMTREGYWINRADTVRHGLNTYKN